MALEIFHDSHQLCVRFVKVIYRSDGGLSSLSFEGAWSGSSSNIIPMLSKF